MMKKPILLYTYKVYDWLIKMAIIALCFISCLYFWLITSDVPIFIDTMELKSFLTINIIQFVLNILIALNAIIKKTSNIIVIITEAFFLCIWFWILGHSNLYKEIEYYKFIVLFGMGCLFVETVSQLALTTNTKDGFEI